MIAAIIPDRGDRPQFMEQCLRMMHRQSMPVDLYPVDYAPHSDKKDITQRYRKGYDMLRGKGYEAIFLIENDDYYSSNYFANMMHQWYLHNKPDIFGTSYTIYYHIGLKKWFTMKHPERASAMNTLIKPDLNFDWCMDEDPYTDLHLWKTLKGITWNPYLPISIGIKHGVGFCGGRMHIDKFDRYKNDDAGFNFLQAATDKESFAFYQKIHSEYEDILNSSQPVTGR